MPSKPEEINTGFDPELNVADWLDDRAHEWNLTDADRTRSHLLMTGLSKGMIALEASEEDEIVPRMMSQIVGAKGRVIVVREAKPEMESLREKLGGVENVIFLHCSLSHIRCESGKVDYVFSRFLFSKFSDSRPIFEEFRRVARDQGKVVIGELDQNGLNHYPLAQHLGDQLNQLMHEFDKNKVMDPFAGRKLYSFFHEAGLRKIRVQMFPHHLSVGEAGPGDFKHWRQLLSNAEELLKQGRIQLKFDLTIFRNEFLAFLENPARFSYSPLILIEGTK